MANCEIIDCHTTGGGGGDGGEVVKRVFEGLGWAALAGLLLALIVYSCYQLYKLHVESEVTIREALAGWRPLRAVREAGRRTRCAWWRLKGRLRQRGWFGLRVRVVADDGLEGEGENIPLSARMDEQRQQARAILEPTREFFSQVRISVLYLK